MQAVPPLPGLPAILPVTIHRRVPDGKTELTSQLVVAPRLLEHLFVRDGRLQHFMRY